MGIIAIYTVSYSEPKILKINLLLYFFIKKVVLILAVVTHFEEMIFLYKPITPIKKQKIPIHKISLNAK